MPGTIKDLIEAGAQIHQAQQLQRQEARRVSDHITGQRGDQAAEPKSDGQGQAAAR